MGADYFVIRGCTLQSRLGAEGFAQTAKQRAQLLAIESRRAEIEQRVGRPLEELRITFGGRAEPKAELTLAELRQRAHLLDDTGECAACPLSGRRVLGCYRYVTYPLSGQVERHFFDYFVDALESDHPSYVVGHDRDGHGHSAAALLHRLAMRGAAPDGTIWHERRGPAIEGGLCELAVPLRARLGSGVELDSAQVLGAALAPAIDGAPALTLYAHLFAGFADYLERHGIEADSAHGLRELRDLAALLTDAAALAKSTAVEVIVWS